MIVVCILISFVAWLAIGERGLIKLYRTEMERQAYIERIKQLTEENQALLNEINRLRTDMKYIESVARKNFNMIKSNEVIYRFDQKTPQDDANVLPSKTLQNNNTKKPESEELHDGKFE